MHSAILERPRLDPRSVRTVDDWIGIGESYIDDPSIRGASTLRKIYDKADGRGTARPVDIRPRIVAHAGIVADVIPVACAGFAMLAFIIMLVAMRDGSGIRLIVAGFGAVIFTMSFFITLHVRRSISKTVHGASSM